MRTIISYGNVTHMFVLCHFHLFAVVSRNDANMGKNLKSDEIVVSFGNNKNTIKNRIAMFQPIRSTWLGTVLVSRQSVFTFGPFLIMEKNK
jgi:hypothetical protein